MTNKDAVKNDRDTFAFDSFVTAFAPGNEYLIDQYFDPNVILFNHSVSKQFNLNDLKSRLPGIHKKYQDLKSEIKDVIIQNDHIAFHVKQRAFYVEKNKHVTMDIMNLYKLSNGKIKEWHMWENFMSDLEHKHCLPCEGGVKPIAADDVKIKLRDIPGWEYDEKKEIIFRRFDFKNFYQTMAFVNAIAWMAHRENHHPDLMIGYNYCEVRYTTHAIQGLSLNDFICAAKVNQIKSD